MGCREGGRGDKIYLPHMKERGKDTVCVYVLLSNKSARNTRGNLGVPTSSFSLLASCYFSHGCGEGNLVFFITCAMYTTYCLRVHVL